MWGNLIEVLKWIKGINKGDLGNVFLIQVPEYIAVEINWINSGSEIGKTGSQRG